jgi:hypothetical protein
MAQNGTLTEILALLNGIPEMREALGLQTAQARRQDPLHAALTQLALNFLPRAGFETNPRRAAMIANLPKSVNPHQISVRNPGPYAVQATNPPDYGSAGASGVAPSGSNNPDDERFRG